MRFIFDGEVYVCVPDLLEELNNVRSQTEEFSFNEMFDDLISDLKQRKVKNE